MTTLVSESLHVTPIITQAAESVNKTPEIVVGIPVCVTDDVAAAKEKIDQQFAIYPTLPSYKAMLDKQGAATASDIALVGNQAHILEGLEELEAAGATEVFAAPCGSSHDRAETFALLGELARNR